MAWYWNLQAKACFYMMAVTRMHTSRGCLGAWGYRGMYAIIAISCLCQEESLKGLGGGGCRLQGLGPAAPPGGELCTTHLGTSTCTPRLKRCHLKNPDQLFRRIR